MSGGAGLDDLYGDMILDHNRRPRNFGRLDGATHAAEGNNPLCGDRVTVYLKVADGRVADIAFEGTGCAISTASASMMTEALRGKSLTEARRLFELFRGMLTAAPASTGTSNAAPAKREERGTPADAADAADAGDAADIGEPKELGKLMAFAGVSEFPMRVKCATLAWHALQSALAKPAAEVAPARPVEGEDHGS
jgi:nitrogen fixation NifU-like protein